MNAGDGLGRLVAELEKLRRQEATVLATVAELDRNGKSAPFGSAAKMIADTGRCGPAESRRLAERALALHGAIGLSGTPIPPALPYTAAAYSDGAISAEHVDRIRGLAETIPPDVLAGKAWPIAEECLATIAQEVGPRGLTRPIRELQERLDPDGQQPDDADLAEPERSIRITQRRNHYEINGLVDTETGLKFQALLDELGKPHSKAANDGRPDARTNAQRHGDAFADMIELAAKSGELPHSGGEPFTILLTATEEATDIGAATTMDGTRIPPGQTRRIACDATIITEQGERKRSAPPALRRALIARDRGCAHPDCDAPPALTQAHHIRHYAHDGPTTMDNMVLLCGRHHRLLHHTAWTVHLHNGRPRFTPPLYRRRGHWHPTARACEARTAANTKEGQP